MDPALASFARSIRALGKVPSRAAAEAAGSIKALIASQFEAQTNPYGKAWAPHADSTVRRWGVHPILDLTGALKAVEVQPSGGAGITITLGAPYGVYHQTTRPILPFAGLPASWSAAIKEACSNAFGEAVG